jgi:hypothetical protein
MIIHGHITNGQIVPDGGACLPDGAKVTIIVSDNPTNGSSTSSKIETKDAGVPGDRRRQLAALAHIDALANENSGDNFRSADHDLALYGHRS